MSDKIQLQEGKRYVRRNGEVSPPVSKHELADRFYKWTDGSLAYSDSGRLWWEKEDEDDLVSEFVEPAPEAPRDAVCCTEDGGPAFPCGYHPEGNSADQSGMTLRDWFAGQALAGLLANTANAEIYHKDARMAYTIADAMIEARKGGKAEGPR